MNIEQTFRSNRAALIAMSLGVVFLLPFPVLAESARQSSVQEQKALLAEAEQARLEAQQAREEASKAAQAAREVALANAELARQQADLEREGADEKREELDAERARQSEEMERAREELSRAHRELREASREIAEAHRALAEESVTHEVMRHINLGDRAVIGVVLGKESPEGVEIIGISPDGPAERAGLQTGDVLVSIRGEKLGDDGGKTGRETVFRVMDEVEAGETLAVVVNRDGEALDFEVTAERREPSSWQTMIRIPSEPHVLVERIEIPEIDHEALKAQVEALGEHVQSRRFAFVSPDGEGLEFDEDFILPETLDIEIAELSDMAGHALHEANMWFGLPYAQGLRLAEINPDLGAYFDTDRGVLVLHARTDNAYGLEAGDVVLEINERPVDSPSDLMRALREIEPGSDVQFTIKRDRKNESLSMTMPENRLGFALPGHRHP